MLNLDTHILLHALTDSVTPRERKLLSAQTWSISAIVPWEIAKLAQLGRIEVDLNAPLLLRTLSKLHVWPIDLAVCRTVVRLDFRGDPADEIIAATSIVQGIPLLTRDRAIKRSKMVEFA
jgi:PIN domain nuclease of toxin-antitoxin system